jgi:hypothetical protein
VVYAYYARGLFLGKSISNHHELSLGGDDFSGFDFLDTDSCSNGKKEKDLGIFKKAQFYPSE